MGSKSCLATYEPINVLKPVGANVWIVDGPVVRMRHPWLPLLSLPFSTRMTVIRLGDGRIWLHSPTAADPELVEAVSALGEIGFLVAPNRLHREFVSAWAAVFPGAEVHAAPGVAEAADRFPEKFRLLGPGAPDGWRGEIDQVSLPGRFMTEFVFSHRPSKTVILTDMLENFEREKVRCTALWWLVRLGGASGARTPRDLRATFPRHDEALRSAAKEIVGWKAERVILAHGACLEQNSEQRLAEGLKWLL